MFAKEEVKTIFRNFLTENFFLNTRAVVLDDNISLMDKGIVDSTGILEVVTFLQSEFGIDITDEEILPVNLDSLNNVANFISKKTQTSN